VTPAAVTPAKLSLEPTVPEPDHLADLEEFVGSIEQLHPDFRAHLLGQLGNARAHRRRLEAVGAPPPTVPEVAVHAHYREAHAYQLRTEDTRRRLH
jgi:hypothetical protein